MLARSENPHVNSAITNGADDLLASAAVRKEIRSRNGKASLGGRDQHLIENAGARRASCRCAVDDHGADGPVRLVEGEIALAEQDLARSAQPVFCECRL